MGEGETASVITGTYACCFEEYDSYFDHCTVCRPQTVGVSAQGVGRREDHCNTSGTEGSLTNSTMRFPLLSSNQRRTHITPQTTGAYHPAVSNESVLRSQRASACGEATATQVVPEESATGSWTSKAFSMRRSRVNWWGLLGAIYHWITCLFISGLVLSQLLAAVWNTVTTTEHLFYGHSPLSGPAPIVGSNDIPYNDRVIACVRTGHFYEPRLVSSLLASEGVEAIEEDVTGAARHGYRLVRRRVGLTTDVLDSTAYNVHSEACALMANTIDNILGACQALGYTNLTRDHLTVIDGVDSDRLFMLPNTLPVLVMPYWDNCEQARHAVPTYEGDACIFRLEDAYSDVASKAALRASFRGVDQSVRHERTIEWLARPGGDWKNGWYEDLEGMRWYTDVTSSTHGAPYNMMRRLFDMHTGREVDCGKEGNCDSAPSFYRWGPKFSTEFYAHKLSSVFIANGSEFGLTRVEADLEQTVRSVFDWETLLSSSYVALVLMRWVLVLVSLHVGALRGINGWHGGGIGSVSGAQCFVWFPVAILPRLSMALAAFWTVGCRFEGQQAGLSEAWFTIYPSIVQLVLAYFSLLNLLAKAVRRRMTDELFAPTVLALCLMHFFRFELASSGWLAGVDSRVPTVVFSDEVQKLRLADYFTTDIAWRMNGRVSLLFTAKLAILGINLLPLVLTRSFPIRKRGTEKRQLHGVEKALAVRAKHVGGLGRSRVYLVSNPLGQCTCTLSTISDFRSRTGDDRETTTTARAVGTQAAPRSRVALLNSFELIRLGYIVFGDQYLIRTDDWDLLSAMAPLKAFCHFWNHRVLVWTLRPATSKGNAEMAGGRALAGMEPEMWRLDDPRLLKIRWWQVSACNIQCS